MLGSGACAKTERKCGMFCSSLIATGTLSQAPDQRQGRPGERANEWILDRVMG